MEHQEAAEALKGKAIVRRSLARRRWDEVELSRCPKGDAATARGALLTATGNDADLRMDRATIEDRRCQHGEAKIERTGWMPDTPPPKSGGLQFPALGPEPGYRKGREQSGVASRRFAVAMGWWPSAPVRPGHGIFSAAPICAQRQSGIQSDLFYAAWNDFFMGTVNSLTKLACAFPVHP